MKKTSHGIFAAILITIAFCSIAIAASNPMLFPFRCVDVFVGVTNDYLVTAVHGEGVTAPEEGHIGARYFTDEGQNVTFHVVIGLDHIIEEASLEQGLHLPKSYRGVPSRAISQALKSTATFDGGIRLGANISEIISRYGNPTKRAKIGKTEKLTYSMDNEISEFTFVANYDAVFEFVDGKLVKATISNGC